MTRLVWISLILALLLLIMAPFVFANLMTRSFEKLHLSPSAALFFTASIFAGGLINIPVKRVSVAEALPTNPLDIFGLSGVAPRWGGYRAETVIALNVGGCLIPSGLAAYQFFHLVLFDPGLIVIVLAGSALNVAFCYALARPVLGVGILMPGLAPPLAAATFAILLAPGQAAPVAFIIGVAGPLVGADLLHLRAIERLGAGMVSIGGAGTFDGIVLSAIVAAYLA
jgi:uncharacterized membrane protein